MSKSGRKPNTAPTPPGLPFEEISQESIIPKMARRFQIEHVHSYLPFWFYLAPKLRMPDFLRTPCARWMRLMDPLGSLLGIRGACFHFEAVKGHHAPDSHQ